MVTIKIIGYLYILPQFVCEFCNKKKQNKIKGTAIKQYLKKRKYITILQINTCRPYQDPLALQELLLRGSFLSATKDSVVNTIAAMEAAFCNAERVTFVDLQYLQKSYLCMFLSRHQSHSQLCLLL